MEDDVMKKLSQVQVEQIVRVAEKYGTRPDHEDFARVEREYPHKSDAEKYRLAQATRYLRLVAEEKD